MSGSVSEHVLVSRRSFLGVSAAAGVWLVLGVRLAPARGATSGEGADAVAIANLTQGDATFEPDLWIRIDTAGIVTISVHRSEMGQRVDTALPMIVADELEADWEQVRIEHAPLDVGYGSQVTGGSASVSSSWPLLRAAAASARMMLVSAAAGIWGVDPAACRAEHGQVVHDATDRRLPYGDLVAAAAALPVPQPSDLVLKDPADFRIIGSHVSDPNGPGYVTGQARFTSDLVVPGMLVAVVARPPTVNGHVASFDPGPTLAVDGVHDVVEIDTGVAVMANSTWAALQGRQALPVTWDEGETASLDSTAIRDTAMARIRLRDDPALVEAVYEVPYLAHAPMEPMDCVADVREDRVEVWAPTQDRKDAAFAAARGAGLPLTAVTLHTPLIGGAFGRRLVSDFVQEACQISAAVRAPVKTFWTREDDIRHDFYHPFTLIHATASRDLSVRPRTTSVSGWGPPTGAWRSVNEMNDGFAFGSILDEMAIAAGVDVLEVYRRLYADQLRPAVEVAAEQSGWGSTLPHGWGRGLAAHATFGATPVAIVVEASVEGGRVRVHRAVCAIDCGIAVDPGGVIAQMEGGIAFALSAALYEEITLRDGRIQQSSFLDFPILRMDEMPTVEVHIMPSRRDPTGVGEMGVPPTAPALMNAVFAATGRRIRHLPIRPEDLADLSVS